MFRYKIITSRKLLTLDLLIIFRWDGLDISPVLCCVLLHLQVEIRHEGSVLLVDDVVGDHEEEHAGSQQGEA